MSPGKWRPKDWPTPKKRKRVRVTDCFMSRINAALREHFYPLPYFTITRTEDAERVRGMKLDE